MPRWELDVDTHDDDRKGRRMTEQRPLGPVSQPPRDDPATRKILDERKADEDKKREADQKTPWGTARNP